jgi:hypothetical protein
VILLGRVQTALGPIELDFSGGVFTTSSTYHDCVTGQKRDTIIVIGHENAREWWELCRERGAVYAEFPEEVQAAALMECEGYMGGVSP